MMTKTIKKSLLGILVACLLSLAVIFTATGVLSARAVTTHTSDTLGWCNHTGNGWDCGIATDSGSTTEVGGKQYSKFTTINNSTIYNTTQLVLTAENPGINVSYKIAADSDVKFFLLPDSIYSDEQATEDSQRGHLGRHCNPDDAPKPPLAITLNGSGVGLYNGFATGSGWSGLDATKYYDINIYIGTGTETDKSYVIINNKKIECNVKLSDFKVTANEEDAYHVHVAMHPKGAYDMEISQPKMMAKPELPPYAVTGLKEHVKLSVGDETTFSCAPNTDLAAIENLQFRWESSAADVATVDATGKVNALKAGTAVIKAVAYTGDGANVQEYAEAACTVHVFPYDSASGWLTSVGDGWGGFGIAQDTFTENNDGTVSFTVNGSTETWNGKAVDPSAGLIHFTYMVGENTDTAKVGMLFHLISQSDFDANLRTADVYPSRIDMDRPGPFGFYAANSVVNFQTNKGNICWEGIEVESDDQFLNIKAGDKVDVAIYVGSGEEDDKSYIVINGNKRIAKAKLSDYGNETDGYKAYLHLFSTNNARAITISKPEIKKNVVFLDSYAKSVEVGDEFTLAGSVASVEAQTPAITWASSDPTVAKVENGKVTALKKGTVKITATAGTGADVYITECAVEVTDVLLTGVTLDKTEISLKVGEKATITATYAPANATCNHDFKWRVQRSSVAAIEGADNVAAITIEALSVGTTRITVTCGEGENQVTANCEITVTKADDPVNPDKTAADAVIAKINAIGEVTLEKETAITEARSAYDALTATQKGLVSEEVLKKLADAETALAGLKATDSGKKKGCGSSAGGGALAIAIFLLAACAVVLGKKKKADNK